MNGDILLTLSPHQLVVHDSAGTLIAVITCYNVFFVPVLLYGCVLNKGLYNLVSKYCGSGNYHFLMVGATHDLPNLKISHP